MSSALQQSKCWVRREYMLPPDELSVSHALISGCVLDLGTGREVVSALKFPVGGGFSAQLGRSSIWRNPLAKCSERKSGGRDVWCRVVAYQGIKPKDAFPSRSIGITRDRIPEFSSGGSDYTRRSVLGVVDRSWRRGDRRSTVPTGPRASSVLMNLTPRRKSRAGV